MEPAQDEAGKLPESAQLEPGELLGPAQDEAGSQGERALEESQGNNAQAGGWASPRSQPSHDSEEDIGAGEEDFESSPEKPPLKDKSERRANEVPPGKFWLHDDRTEDDANNRWAYVCKEKVHLLTTITSLSQVAESPTVSPTEVLTWRLHQFYCLKKAAL